MPANEDATLAVLASMQNAIRKNQSVFDNLETIDVTPAFQMVHGKPDPAQPYIQVRARRVADLKRVLPPSIDGFQVRVEQASLDEEANRAAGMRRAGVTADSLEARTAWRTGLLELVPELKDYSKLTYTPMNPSRLTPLEEPMELILHVSPEAGWSELQKFLQNGNWTIAMYDFTAPHIVEAVESAVGANGDLTLVLDRKLALPSAKQLEAHPDDVKANDKPEVRMEEKYSDDLGGRFHFTWASTGSEAEFASSYHIKVAVRNREEFWLSSGNWQSSNQPATDFLDSSNGNIPLDVARDAARYNREWHVICRNASLADVFAAYIKRDYERAEGSPGPSGAGGGEDESAHPEATNPESVGGWRPIEIPDEDFIMEMSAPTPLEGELEAARRPVLFFRPLSLSGTRKVQPILTPDNYEEIVAPLVEGSETRLWFQNQSLSVIKNPSEGYTRLLTALKDKSWQLEDCRIIFRDYYRPQTKDLLRALRQFGFNMDKVRVMKNCHTKGILVDSKRALIGSHNWTNEGTTYNRDASLLFDDPEVAAYFEQVFDHDWENQSYSLTVTEESAQILLFPGEAPRPGTTVVPLELRDHDGIRQFQ